MPTGRLAGQSPVEAFATGLLGDWSAVAVGRALESSVRWASGAMLPEVCCSRATNRPVVSLTFDDGPHPELTDAVLDVLAKHNARATFFLIGERVPGQERSVARIVDEGHEIGNHMMRDEPSILMPRDDFHRDLRATQDLLAPYQQVRWWRPASGWFTSSMIRHAAGLGLRCALGTMAITDGPPPASESWRSSRLLAQLRPGSVAVLHEGTSERRDVVSTTDWLLSQMRQRGLSSVTLSELAAA